MAVDTAQKRLSMMDFGNPFPIGLFEPDGSIDLDDRTHLLGLYSGIVITAQIIIQSVVVASEIFLAGNVEAEIYHAGVVKAEVFRAGDN